MTKNRIAGILAVLLGGAYLAATFRIPVFAAADEIGPRAFPFLVGVVVIGCGLALIVEDIRKGDGVPFSWGFLADRVIWLRILATIAAGIIYGLVLEDLGYLIATVLFMLVVTSLINVGKHVQNVVISLVFSLVTFTTFALILKLSLPRGLLGGILPF